MSADSGRLAAIARINRQEKNGPQMKYKRVQPEHPNKVLVWVAEHRSAYALVGGIMPDSLYKALKKKNLNPRTYKRILLNETIVTLDELYNLADIFGCTAKDLI